MKLSMKIAVVSLVFGLGTLKVHAQEIPATGGLFTDDETYSQFDSRPRIRSEILVRNADLSPMFPTPGHQGQQGSCTGWAVSYAARSYYESKKTGRKPEKSSDIFSPAFQYNMTAADPNDTPVCGGAYIHKVLKSMRDIGALTLNDIPYNSAFCSPDYSLNSEYLERASTSKILDYKVIPRDSIKGMTPFKEALQEGHPVIINVKVPKVWSRRTTSEIQRELGPDGLLPGSFHAMVAVGFNEDLRAIKLMNSWGTNWSDEGFIWVDYDVFSEIIVEAYTISGLEPPIVPVNAFKMKDEILRMETKDPLQISQNILNNYQSIKITNRIFDSAGNLKIAGYGCADSVERAKAEIMLASPKVVLNLREDPWPICEISGLVSQDQIGDEITLNLTKSGLGGRGIKIGTKPKKENSDSVSYLSDGDRIKINIIAPAEKPFLQVFWLQADNSVKEIHNGVIANLGTGNYSFEIGGDGEKALTVQEPFGTEALLVLASNKRVIEYSFEDDTADYAFLDYLRYPSAKLKADIANAAIGIKHIQISSSSADTNNWLVTPVELRTIGSGAVKDLITREIENIGDPLGPNIIVSSPDVSQKIKGDNIVIAATFEPKDGATILPETLQVKYKKFGGWFNVTDRVRKGATKLDSAGIESAPLQLPKGKHRLKVSIQDNLGREAKVDIRAKVE